MSGNRQLWGRGKGYLNAAGSQYRFIIFLLLVLGAYTFLLKVFQKLAEIAQLPVFFTISLIALLFFVGVVGTLYSHTFVGPMQRIRRVLEHLSHGDTDVSLRLRDSNDPMLKDLVKTVTQLCDHSRSSHILVQETARDLFADIELLQEKVRLSAQREDIQRHIEGMRAKQDLLEKAIKSFGNM